jgi:hypothetical protein
LFNINIIPPTSSFFYSRQLQVQDSSLNSNISDSLELQYYSFKFNIFYSLQLQQYSFNFNLLTLSPSSTCFPQLQQALAHAHEDEKVKSKAKELLKTASFARSMDVLGLFPDLQASARAEGARLGEGPSSPQLQPYFLSSTSTVCL